MRGVAFRGDIARPHRPDMGAALRAEAGWRRRNSALRVALPAAAGAILAALIAWPMFNRLEDRLAPGAIDPELAAESRDRATDPRFESIDSANRPYTVVAATAWREDAGGDRVFLVDPEADMPDAAEGGMIVVAARGVLDRDREFLVLDGGVEMRTGSGTELLTDSASFDMRAGEAVTDDPVQGRGPWGRLDATGCAWRSEGRILRCGGRPTLVLYPRGIEGEG